MYKRLLELFGLNKARQPRLQQTDVSGSLRVITEHEVMNHCKNSGGIEFMCKNCGATYNALAVTRQYCNGCNCWLCHRCSGELCGECKQ